MTNIEKNDLEYLRSKLLSLHSEREKATNPEEKNRLFWQAKSTGVQIFIQSKLRFVGKMRVQMTDNEVSKIVKKYSRKALLDILERMDNYAGIEKKYNSVYRTAMNWLDRDKARYTQPEWADGNTSSFKEESKSEKPQPGKRYTVKGISYEALDNGSLINTATKEIVPKYLAIKIINN